MEENVILIDQDDRVIGTMEKMQAHVEGKLHRAISVFIFNTAGELLMQQRAFEKYHSGGKWSNTCCSHPALGEETNEAACRRLQEEMGMDCEMFYAFNFTYKVAFDDGISEHEYDHVYFGVTNATPVPNPAEVAAVRYMKMKDLADDLHNDPGKYTKWLYICFDKVLENYSKIFKV